MTNLYSADQSKQLDLKAQVELGVEGYELMCRAGEAAFKLLLERWPTARRLVCLCGGGNNGGDAWVVGRMAHLAGLEVVCISQHDENSLHGEALQAFVAARAEPLAVLDHLPNDLMSFDVVVDGLLGTGFRGDLRQPARDIITAVNASNIPVISLDIPSGVNADSNLPVDVAINANVTLAFIAWKIVHFTGPGRNYCGECYLDNLAVDRQCREGVPYSAQLLDVDDLLATLPHRRRDSHKGHFGHVVAIGGDNGFGGAIILAAKAAQRSGAGLVTALTRLDHIGPLLAQAPQIMARGVDITAHSESFMDSKNVLLIGPGLGLAAWGQQLLQKVLASGGKVVMDADALNLIATLGLQRLQALKQCVITPHPGEAARLLGCDVATIETDRLGSAIKLHQLSGAAVVLKGRGSVVVDEKGVAICPYGNPGMASGGVGDVLSGIIAALLAQGLSVGDALRLGVAVHSKAADLEASEFGELGMAAIDLIARVRALLNG